MIFDKFKQIAQLKQIQDNLKKEKVVIEKNGVSIEMNGNFDVENIKLNPDLSVDDQQNALKYCLSEAKSVIQKKMAQIMMGSGIGL